MIEQHLTGSGRSAGGGYAPVNGLSMYYEIRGGGAGVHLVTLHGGLGSSDMFGRVDPMLAVGRQIVALDLQAHGRTADIDRPLRFESLADDVAALVKHLGLQRADVMGYSFGGGTALQTAIRHPEVVRKLVVVSNPFKRDGWYPEIRAGMEQVGRPEAAEGMKQSPMYQAYVAVAPEPQDWPVLLSKMSQLLSQDYDWSREVAALRMPVMVVVGDADAVRPRHAVEFFELLGGGKADAGWDRSGMSSARLAILPGLTHYDIFSSPALASAVVPFLDETVEQRA